MNVDATLVAGHIHLDDNPLPFEEASQYRFALTARGRGQRE